MSDEALKLSDKLATALEQCLIEYQDELGVDDATFARFEQVIEWRAVLAEYKAAKVPESKTPEEMGLQPVPETWESFTHKEFTLVNPPKGRWAFIATMIGGKKFYDGKHAYDKDEIKNNTVA